MQCLVNMVDESELSSQVVSGNQRNMWSCATLMEDYESSVD